MTELRISAHGEGEFIRWYDSEARREGELEAVHQALLDIAARAWRRLYYADDLTEPGRLLDRRRPRPRRPSRARHRDDRA